MEEQILKGGEEIGKLRGQGVGWFLFEVVDVTENNRNKNRKK